MNLEHYKNFVAIVDAGTISAASEKLLIAQPALTKQIQQLETKYGAQLMIRKPRHVELTDAGQILYDKIKSICYLEDAARKEINACIVGNRGTLWLGRTPSAPDALIDSLLLDFHRAYPEINFEMFERNSEQIIELLQSGMVEVGIIRSQHFIPVTLQPIMTEQEFVMAYFSVNHPLLDPANKTVRLSMLQDLPISISKGLKNGFELACESAGFKPNYMNISASRATSMLWARDGRTVCIIVNSKPFDDGEYCCRRIEVENLNTLRAIAVSRERRISTVAETFLSFCRNSPLTADWTVCHE